MAELHAEPIDGMTPLSQAIAERDPTMDPKGIYGLRSLKEILLISGLFDVKVDGDTVWYRSKRELRDSPLNENLTGLSWSVIRHA